MYKKSDYSYTLPEELIAETAVHPHHDARLLVVERDTGEIASERTFWHLPDEVRDNRVFFFNNSRVLRARVRLSGVGITRTDGSKGSIEDGEVFYLNTLTDNTIEALVRPGNKFREGTIIHLDDTHIRVVGTTDVGRILQIEGSMSIYEFLEKYGTLPLPPYIEYSEEKEKDYQTSFASKDGSVAAPTASLHFTTELMQKIQNPKEYVTLHVGLGTFKGLDTDDVREYAIHREAASVGIDIFTRIYQYKFNNQKIVAVGTTACRTLESLPSLWESIDTEWKKGFDPNICNYWDSLAAEREKKNWIYNTRILEDTIYFETEIYIVPGHMFSVIDDLITNFHLGESSLLVLVSAFLGYNETMSLYKKAIEKKYRFYSFGDGMYIRGK